MTSLIRSRKVPSSIEFDYVLNFPTPNPGATVKEPVVFLFGWAGCRDRYLARYSSLYERQGCITLRYTLPTDVLFWHYQLLPSLGEKIYEAIVDLDLQENPLVFHIFSGCGCAVFNAFRRYCIRTGETDLKIAAVIYDSAPAATSYYQRALAFTEIFYPGLMSWKKSLTATVAAAFFFVFDRLKWLWGAVVGSGAVGLTRRHWRTELEEDRLDCPNLFLYSKADLICSDSSIEEFIRGQQSKKVDTTAIKWDDSPHCQHLRLHEDEYKSAVISFIEKSTGHRAKEEPQGQEPTTSGANGDDTDDFEKVERNGD